MFRRFVGQGVRVRLGDLTDQRSLLTDGDTLDDPLLGPLNRVFGKTDRLLSLGRRRRTLTRTEVGLKGHGRPILACHRKLEAEFGVLLKRARRLLVELKPFGRFKLRLSVCRPFRCEARELLNSREVVVAPNLLFARDHILNVSDLAWFVSLDLL